MKERISKILKEEGMTAAKLADEIGVQASGISHILSGRNNPSIDFVTKLLERFRGINPEWLLLGKGEMYKTNQNISGQSSFPSSASSENDLFTQVKDDNSKYSNNELQQSQEDLIKTIDITQEPPKLDENIKNMEIDNNNVKLGKKELKKIEKVIVLFDDGTFEYYNQS